MKIYGVSVSVLSSLLVLFRVAVLGSFSRGQEKGRAKGLPYQIALVYSNIFGMYLFACLDSLEFIFQFGSKRATRDQKRLE